MQLVIHLAIWGSGPQISMRVCVHVCMCMCVYSWMAGQGPGKRMTGQLGTRKSETEDMDGWMKEGTK